MRDSTTPSRFPKRLKRVLAGALSTMLVAGGLVAVSVAAPLVAAPSASAASNFQCGTAASPQLYLTSNVANERRVFGLDATTGATSLAYTPSPAVAAGTLNQLALSRGGQQMFWTNGASSTAQGGGRSIYEYTPGGAAGTAGDLQVTPRPIAASPANNTTMGGYDLDAERYIFGGATYNPTGSTILTLQSYDPTGSATSTPVGNIVHSDVARILLPSAAGGNGDLAFAPDGTMYVVTGGNNSNGDGSGGADEAQLYRVTGGIGTQTAPGTGITHTAVELGERIPNIRGLNSIGFGADGFLYLFGTTVTANGGAAGAAALVKVNPSSGAIVSRTPLAAGATGTAGATDFASCASPSTASGSISVPAPVKPTDSFDVVVTGPNTPANETGNQGSTGPIGTGPGEAEAGPILVLPGQPVTIGLTPTPGSGTNLGDYDPSWQCVNTSAEPPVVVNSGWGTSASYLQPATAPLGATIDCTFQTSGGLSLDKSSDVATVNAIGDVVTYSFRATNAGLSDVQSVQIADGMQGLSALSCTPALGGSIAPGGSITCTATRAATAADFQAVGPITNTATATGVKPQRNANGVVTSTQPASSSDTVDVQPNRAPVVVEPETSQGNEPGATVTVPVAQGVDIQPGSIVIVGAPGDGKQLVVDEGTWTVDDAAGTIVFVPNGPNAPNPAPIEYTATGQNGVVSAPATVMVTYAPGAVDDTSTGNELDQPVTVPVLDNDLGAVVPGTVQLIDPATNLPTTGSVTVPGGVWSVDPATGSVVYTPNEGDTTNPAPIGYQVEDAAGVPTQAIVTVTFQPVGTDDLSVGNMPNESATVSPLANDRGDLDPATLAFVDPATGLPLAPGTPLVIDGEGTWSYDPATGVVTFTPEEGFEGDPTPVDYVASGPGGTTGATITVEYSPLAVDDSSLGNTIGDDVTVDVLDNDSGELVPSSVVLIDPTTGLPLAEGEDLVVDGQGTWSVDPETGAITFTPAEGYEGDPTPVGYQVTDADGDTATATVTVGYVPVAADDASLDNTIGDDAVLDVLANDAGVLDPATVAFLDPATGTALAPGASYTVEGQGVWSIAPTTGVVTFAPEPGFQGDPTPIDYQVADLSGDLTSATITVSYLPVAADDADLDNTIGDAVPVDVLANDAGVFDLATLALIDPETGEALAPGAQLVVDGEGTWTIDAATGIVTFEPEEGYQGDPTPVDYQVADLSGDVTGATITVSYLPVAQDDADLANTIGDDVTIDVLANDAGVFDPATLAFIDPATGLALAPGADLVVEGQGTWSIDDTTGEVTFSPETGYEGDPSPVGYQVADLSGDVTGATITVGYVPAPVDDEDLGNTIGDAVTIDVLANDIGVYDPATVAFIDPATGLALAPGASLTVDGQGVWSIDQTNGFVTFEPAEGYQGDPTPVGYQAADLSGDLGTAIVTVTYLPVAADDSDVDNVVGTTVTIDVLANDAGVFDPTTVAIIDPETGEALAPGAELVVDGEGTWTIDPANGAITFEPEEGFQGDPTPIDYQVEDLSEDVTGATVTVGYVGVAADDSDLGNTIGETVVIDVLANDAGVFDPATLAFIDPATGLALAPGADLVVDGQGTWSIDATTGAVTFEPAEGYQGDPTPVGYQVADLSGDVTGATITVGYLPVAADDLSEGNTIGQPAVIDVLANDAGVFDPATVAFIDPETGEALAPGADLVVEGQGTWSIAGATGVVTFEPELGYEGDPTPVGYQVADLSGDVTSAIITVDYQPVAVADESLGNALETTVTIPVLDNDSGVLDPTTVAIVDPATGEPLAAGDALVVDGEGTWSIDPETGAITFTPETGFVSDPTPIAYVVEDLSGTQTGSTVTVDYLQSAVDDALLDQPITTAVTVPVLANDLGDFAPATLALIDPATGLALAPGASLVVPGEGTWTIDPAAGTVTFTPEEGYLGDPTPVGYQVADRAGDVVSATVTVSYLPVANDDEDLANAFQEVVTIDVLANDVGDFDPATVRFVDAEGVELEAGQSLVVEGEGTWSIDPETGSVTFTPEPGYGGDPTPVTYRVTDSTGDTAEAIITITYGPTAVDDASLRNAQGSAVTVDVLANDLGQFDPGSVRIVSGDQLVLSLVVPGQGTWTVDQETGAITFTPASGFTGNPTPITYSVTDVTGDVTEATVTITYLPQANDDRSEGNAPGTAVTVDPLANDAGDLDPTTVEIRDPQTGEWGSTVVVPGEGTWTVDPVTGAITFTPERGFTGDPTPIEYRVTDVNGEVTQATVTIDYAQVAPAPGPGSGLPQTGAELTLWALVAGLGLLLAGAAVWLLRRRRA